MGRLASLVIVVVSLALSSCGGEDGDGDGSKTGPTPSADKTPLERRDAPPAGVAEQVSYFAAGNGGCPESDYPAVRFNYGFPRENQAPIGQIGFTICMRGFAKERSVRVKVRRPDGREVVRRVEFDRAYGLHPLSWVPLPGDPLGRHDVTADQGATTANASFYVRRAPAPRVFALESPVPPGRPVPIILAGFEAGQRVRLHLYRLNKGEDGQFSYLTSITVRTDNRGELLHPLATDEDAVRATYLVRLNEQVQDSFDLQKPPPGSR